MGMGKILVLAVALLACGCTTRHCREQNPEIASKTKWVEPPAPGAVKDRVLVYKPDGSLQCNRGQAISTEVMAKELKGIEIFSMDNRSDGMMRVQVCGAATGRINVYEIAVKDYEKAVAMGFKELKQ
jgi:hypothetical protein